MSGKWVSKKYFVTAMKIVGYFALGVVALLLLLIISIQVPYVQNKLVSRATSFLQTKIGTRVSLDYISLSFPKKLVLGGLYLQGQDTDTLLYAGELKIDTDLWSLTRNEIQLNDVSVEKLQALITRSSTGTFNFDYIIKAFAAGETDSPVDTTSTPWTFSIGDVNMEDIRLLYRDSLDGNSAAVSFAELHVDVDNLDLEKSRLDINEIGLKDARADVTQWDATNGKITAASAPATSSPFAFSVKKVTLNDIAADYRNITSNTHARINIGDFLLMAQKMDLNDHVLELDRVELTKSFLSYQQGKSNKEERQPDTVAVKAAKSSPWNISLHSLKFVDNNAQYYDYNFPAQRSSIDFNHLWMTRLNIDARELAMKGRTLAGRLEELSLIDQSGFSISSGSGSFELSETAARIKDLRLKTPQSEISMDARASYSSLEALDKTYPEAGIDLNVKRSTVAIRDVLYFSPDILDSIPVNIPLNTTVTLDTKVSGKVSDLKIDKLQLETLSKTSVTISGNIKGLPESNAEFDIALTKFHTERADVQTVLPDTLLPGNMYIPAWLELTAKLRGSVDAPRVIADLKTEIGSIAVNGTLNQKKGIKPKYEADVVVSNFHVGRLIGQAPQIGSLTMKANVHGSGFTMDDLNARIAVKVNNFDYNHYAYRDFVLNGNVDRYFFSGDASLHDKNLDFTLKGDLDYNKDIPQYDLMFKLVNADFKALGISERPLRARGTLDVKMETSDFKVLNGNLDIRNVGIYNGDALYIVDSLLFASVDQEGESKISIRSDIISGDFEGTIDLASMPDAIRQHFNEYFSLEERKSVDKKIAAQKFSFNLVIKNTDLLTEILLPDLEPFIPGKIEGEFDSEANTLNLHADVAHVRYAGVGLDSVTMNVTSDKKSLDYSLALRKIVFDTLKIEAIKLTGKVASDSIRTKLTILDSAQRDKYILGGAFYSDQKTLRFRLLPEEVIMHYAAWETPKDNYLNFTPEGILAHNFSITNINEKISFVTQEEKSARTAIVFKDLNLQNITNLVEGTVLVDGLLNGNFIVSGEGSFKSALDIKQLKILGQEWGDLGLTLVHETSGISNIDMNVQGKNAEFKARGKFTPDSVSSQIDVVTNISRINLNVIEPFAAGQLKNSSGIITGEVTVKGKASSPEIRGFIAFNDATVVPSFVNSKFLLKDEKISFTNEGIVLDNFRVLDEKNNAATLKGKIKTTDYSKFELDLNLTAKNFQLLNTKAGENDLFYGKVGINTTARIAGTMTQPKIVMEVSLNDDSDVTYIIPQSEKGVIEQKGIIEWVDRDASKDPFLAKINARDTVKSTFTGLDLTANIELDDKEKLSIIIDPVTGDKLTVQGNSTLTLDIDPSGDMTLSGRYEITAGSYELTFYKLVKRNFAIEKGSTITWAGDPLDATLDIKASFEVETSPMELVASQSTGSAVDNAYKQRLPFLVYLNIDGNLMTPEISFELDMPSDKRGALGGSVYAKIKDINTRESDLNKQVFALLILRRFISDNLFDSQGSDVASTARRSVSKLLTEQLNRLSQNVKGIELSFDVKSYDDYSTGQAQGQTEVQLGVSKSLLDNRLVVKVSGNVDIEGNASNQSSFTDYIGDLALEYKLTPDGRFRITGFRNSNYDIISGELIETGAGLIYIKDYNTLRELFKANAKEK